MYREYGIDPASNVAFCQPTKTLMTADPPPQDQLPLVAPDINTRKKSKGPAWTLGFDEVGLADVPFDATV